MDHEHIDDEHLEALEEAQQKESASLRPHVVHEVIRQEGELELARPLGSLAWSGLAAGLSMGFSHLADALLRAHLPDAAWTPLVAHLGYALGFVIVILARQQLFTENTLLAIIPLLSRFGWKALAGVARLWAVVLATNLFGAFLFAWAVRALPIPDGHVSAALLELGRAAARPDAGAIFWKAVFAGWLIALMVWMLPAAQNARVVVIIVMTWLVAVADLAHVVAGSVEVLYAVVAGAVSPGRFFVHYFLPTLAGNVVGGVALVAAVNHAQVVTGEEATG